jgi:hypothetical protein
MEREMKKPSLDIVVPDFSLLFEKMEKKRVRLCLFAYTH